VRRLIALVVVGFIVFSVVNSNYDGIRDFVEEQLDGSTTSAGPQEEATDALPEEAQSAAELGGLEADSVEFAEFPLPAGASPGGVEVGFDAVWYLDNHPNNKVGKLDPATGELLAQYSSPTPGLGHAIAIGFDAVWFAPEGVDDTQPAEVIFKLDPSDGSITSFPLPIDSGPSRMTTGFGYVWYTAIPHNAIGRLDPVTGDVVEYPIPTAGSLPVGITTGFEAVWFSEVAEDARKVGRLDPGTGEIAEYPMLSQTGFQCCGVATGFDAVWYTASNRNVIGRLDPVSGTVVEYPLPNPGSVPVEIVAGPDAVWFTEIQGNRIGRLEPGAATITEYPVPGNDPGPFGIAEGSIWFSASRGGSIGRLDS
jgi:virginiamycin B lyase